MVNKKKITESKSLHFFTEQLHEASTVGVDSMADHARMRAVKLGDKQLLAKLSTTRS